MPKQKIIILVAGIILALTSLVLVTSYIDQQVKSRDELRTRSVAKQLANQVSVLVAKDDIAKGTVIDSNLFETAIVPNQYAQPQAVTSLDRISGMVTVALINKGEQITLNKLISAHEAGGGSLAMATPSGKRAVTISVDNISSVGGMVRPGDYVDVIATVPVPTQTSEGKQAVQAAVLPLFQNVLVLAIGQQTGTMAPSSGAAGRYEKGEKQEASPLVTLALNPQEANLIAFVYEQGKLRLVLRSPSDAKIEPVQPATWETLFQYMAPKEAQEAKPREPQQEGPTVEIYRGLNKEKIPLSK